MATTNLNLTSITNEETFEQMITDINGNSTTLDNAVGSALTNLTSPTKTLVPAINELNTINSNSLQLVNIYTGTGNLTFNPSGLVQTFKNHATNVYIYVSEKKSGDTANTSTINTYDKTSTSTTIAFTALSTERMVIPLITYSGGSILSKVVLENFLKTYFASGANGYLGIISGGGTVFTPTFSGTPFMFEKYISTTGLFVTNIERYSDGRMTQKLKHSSSSLAITTGTGPTYSTSASYTWDFIVAFTNTNYNVLASATGGYYGIRTATEAVGSIQFTPFAWTSATAPLYIANIQAEGNWR